MAKIASFLHISDMHIVEELMEEGRSLYIKGPNSHSYAKLDALAAAVFEIKYVRKKKIDLVVLTGDVTTDGSKEALQSALEFIEEEDIYKYTPRRRVLSGLGAKLGTRIIIPGNHDRYKSGYKLIPQQVGNQLLENVFKAPSSYPYAIGYCHKQQAKSSNVSTSSALSGIIFFVCDSTLVQSGRHDYLNKIARGRIEAGECNRLKELALKIKSTGEVSDLLGIPMKIDFRSSVKVALLHHHPVMTPEQQDENISLYNRIIRRYKQELTQMENSQIFVDACFDAEIDLVLFGHQHQEYETILSRESALGSQAVRFFCCPSATEFSETMNGFNLIDIYTDRFEVEYYRWRGSGKRLVSFVHESTKSFGYIRKKSMGRGQSR